MKLGDVPPPPASALAKATQAVSETMNQCLDSIAGAVRETLGDLGGIDPPASPAASADAPADGGWRHTLARPLSAYLEAAGDHVKDAVLDLEVSGGDRSEAAELPPLDREEFVRVGREHFDRLVGEFADAVNREPNALAIERNTEDVHHLLGELGVMLLDTAVTMRIEKAAQENAPVGDVQPGPPAAAPRRDPAAAAVHAAFAGRLGGQVPPHAQRGMVDER